jgi:hypothetical protein
MRAPFATAGNFRYSISRRNMFSDIAKWLSVDPECHGERAVNCRGLAALFESAGR